MTLCGIPEHKCACRYARLSTEPAKMLALGLSKCVMRYQMSRTVMLLFPAPFEERWSVWAPVPLKFIVPIRWTRLLPTASTAPRGSSSDGVWEAISWTLKSRIWVPFQTPAVPLGISISLANTNPHKRDSYHPRASEDHSKRCTRTGDCSILSKSMLFVSAIIVGKSGASTVDALWLSWEITVSIVFKGNTASQLSIYRVN